MTMLDTLQTRRNAAATRRKRWTISAAAVLAFGTAGALAWQADRSPVQAQDTTSVAGTQRVPLMRLISQSQYINTIAQVFGPDIEVKLRLAPVNRVDGLLGVGASSAVLTGGGLDPLDAASRSIAEQVVSPERRGQLIGCQPVRNDAPDDACAAAFLGHVGKLLYRRTLTQEELAQSVGIARSAAATSNDFYDGLSLALSRLLISPKFLFITESREADPAMPGQFRIDGYSKATRLSFLLWNSPPDEALLAAAERGELHSDAGLKRQVDRMIASPLYREGVRAFFNDFLVLEAFDTMAKDPTIYPAMTLKAIGEAREQLLRTVVDHLVDRQGDYRDLYTTRKTFLSSDLAVLYRLPVHLGSQGWVPYEFPASDPRAGILTQIGFLSQFAHPGRSSATRRGKAIRINLLCQHVPDPPPNVDFSKFEGPKAVAATARERLSVHNENPVCAGCHKITDPIGLSLENFDGAGQFRSIERGSRIDASGSLDGTAFTDAAGLGMTLRDNPALRSCVVSRLYAYSTGRTPDAGQEALLGGYQTELDRQGYRFDTMLRMIVLDPSFFAVNSLPANNRTAYLGGSHADQK